MNRAQLLPSAAGALVCLLVSGCLGYHLGATGKTVYHTVAVPMFRNKTLLPQMEAQITNAIIKRLQADGTLRVAPVVQADVVVHGEITHYNRTTLRTELADTNVPREYRVTITVRIEVRDQRTGQIVVPSTTFEGRADTFIGTDLQTADYQALPLAADDLARQVVTLLAERW